MKHFKVYILVVAISCISFVSCNNSKKMNSDSKEEKVLVKVVPVLEKTLNEKVHTVGNLFVAEDVWLNFKTGGVVNKIFVTENQRVTKGQLCANLNMTEIQGQLKQTQSSLAKAERDKERIQKLYLDSAATLEQLENALTVYELAKENCNIANFNFQYSQILSPFDGIIVKKLASEGEIIAPLTPVFLLYPLKKDNLLFKGYVSDRDRVKIQLGDSAHVRIESYPNRILTGKVIHLGETLEMTNKLYPVEIQIKNIDGMIPGLCGEADLFPSNKNIFKVIPIEAIIEGDGNTAYVYTIDRKNMRAYRVKILILALDGDQVYVNIDTNLSEVITEGVSYLSQNAKVNLIEK